ncbi:hypothetical protein HDU77_001234 [Chytriomyces hyalinus]|nr:hypothetical protein HDU77_001234 [Chytriomyces hyalinus]
MSLSDSGTTAGQTYPMQSVRSQQDATNSSDHSAHEVQKAVQAVTHHVGQESERELNQQVSQGNDCEQNRESGTEKASLGSLRDSPQRITTTGVYVQASSALESPIIPSESPVIRPILKKSTSATQLNSTMAPDASSSILDSFKVTPVHSPVPNISSKFKGGSPTATRSHIHTSKSAPNLSKTPDWMPEYRRSGRRDSVKSLCFDNAIKKVCVFSSDESPARIAQSPRYVIESSDEGSSPESDIEEILGSGSFDYFDDYDDFTEGSLSKKPITKIYEPWVVNSRSHKFPNLTFPAVTLDSLMLSSSKSNTILSPSSTSNPTSGSHSQQPQRVTATILIRNIAYSKFVLVRYTSDGWKSFHDVEATFQGVVIPSTSSTAGIDRFMASIDLDKISPPVPAKMNSFYEEGRDFEHEILNFEFAVCGRMNGAEYWDNNCGRNHELILHRGVRLMPLMSAATAALMTASKGTLRTVEAVIEAAQKAAVQTAKAVAEEAKAIERDFEQSSPYRRNSLPSPTLELEKVPDTRPVRAQFTLNSVSRSVTAGGTPVMRRKAGILGGGGWGNGLYSLCAPSFSDDDDDDEYDDQDTIVPEKPATIVSSHIQEYHSDWAFGSHHVTSASVESGGDSDSATATYPPPWALQRPAQYQSDTLYSLSSRAGSPVSLSTELSAFPSSFYHHHQQQHQQQQQQQNQTANNLYNHGHTLLHRVQHYQQQKHTPVKHDMKAELQKHDLKLDTFKIGKMFGKESFFHTQKSASSSFESASTLADSPSDSLSSIESESGHLSGGLHLKYDGAVSIQQQQENVATKFLRRSKSTDLISRQQPSRHPQQQQQQQQQHKKHMWDSRVSAGDLDTILGRTDEDDAEDMKRILDRKVMQSIEGWSLWDADGENDE